MLSHTLRRFSFSIKDIIANYQPLTSNTERLSIAAQEAVKAFLDPKDGKHVSLLTDTTSYYSLQSLKQVMEEDEEGS